MESATSPIASLSNALPAALQVRPAPPSRTPSSSSLRRSSARNRVPRVHLAVEGATLPEDITEGVRELARRAVRQNVRVVERGEEPQDPSVAGGVGLGGKVTWLVRCVHAA